MVNTGVSPDVIAQEYEAKTGVKLRIFNFGVEGMDIQTNAELAGLLVEQYHPKAILFFTEMREYGPQTDNTVYEGYKHAAWFQYKLGNPSLEGWFFDHSAAMQYFLPYRNWSRADFPDKILSDLYRYHQTLPMGYEPDMGIGKSIDLIPNPDDPAQQYLYDLYADFKPDQNSLAALESILMLHKEGVQVLVTEMPAYESFYEYFGGESVHQEFIKTISALTTEKDGFYIPPIDPGLIPLNGRVDNHHLNYKGTQIYSELLSDELSGLCLDGKTCLANEAAQ